jgi:hypothetical protein
MTLVKSRECEYFVAGLLGPDHATIVFGDHDD